MGLSSHLAAVRNPIQALEALAVRLEVRELSSRVPSSVQTVSLAFQSGASGAAAALIMIVLAFAMLRRLRRKNCLCHNRGLEEVVPSLPYRKRNVDVEMASVDTSELDVSVWMLTYQPEVCGI